MKNLFALLGMVTLVGSFSLQPALADTGTYLTSFNFTNQGKDGTLSFTCFGERTGTGYEETLPNISLCNGTTEMSVTWNGKTVRQRIETTLPTLSAELSASERAEDYGLVWLSPRVINGSLKKLLMIQNNLVGNLVSGVGGPHSNATFVFDFGTQKFIQLTNPTGRKLYWNKAGTRALFAPDTCGGGGCTSTTALMGITLTSKQAVAVTKIKAAFSYDFRPASNERLYTGDDKPVQTWKSLRWITDRVFEVSYITAQGQVKTARGSF